MRQQKLTPWRTLLRVSNKTREQVAALEQVVSDQVRRVAEQAAEIQHQRVRAAQQDEAIALLRGELADRSAPVQLPSPAVGQRSGVRGLVTTSRRTLLHLGGVGAAAGVVVAASSMVGGVQTAHAAGGAGDGTNVVQGSANINTSSTGTILNPNASSSPAVLLTSDNSTSGSKDTGSSGLTAIGPYNTNGVIGIGNGSGGYGVWGKSDAGIGLVGQSTTGLDLGAFGTGRIQQILQLFQGAPTTGTYTVGEQIRDSDGELWICVANGSPGSWRKVAAPQVGIRGGAANFLTAPIRIFDTRSSEPAPLPTAKGSLASGSTSSIQVTGTVVGGLSVPTGAVAVIGNLTVTSTQGGGDLRLFPHGAALPLTSSINYGTAQTVANFAIVALNSTGVMDLYVDGAGTHALFDVVGFIM